MSKLLGFDVRGENWRIVGEPTVTVGFCKEKLVGEPLSVSGYATIPGDKAIPVGQRFALSILHPQLGGIGLPSYVELREVNGIPVCTMQFDVENFSFGGKPVGEVSEHFRSLDYLIMLQEAGLIGKDIRRVVIDIDIDKYPTVYVEHIGDVPTIRAGIEALLIAEQKKRAAGGKT